MMEESARVLEISEGRARVCAERQSSCGHCDARQGCGTSVLSNYLGQRSLEMWVDDPLGVEVGDEVLLQLKDGGVVSGSLLVYLVPLLGFIVFAILGEALARQMDFNGEWMSIAGAIIGALSVYRWLGRQNSKFLHDKRFRPVIIKRLNTVSFLSMGSGTGN